MQQDIQTNIPEWLAEETSTYNRVYNYLFQDQKDDIISRETIGGGAALAGAGVGGIAGGTTACAMALPVCPIFGPVGTGLGAAAGTIATTTLITTPIALVNETAQYFKNNWFSDDNNAEAFNAKYEASLERVNNGGDIKSEPNLSLIYDTQISLTRVMEEQAEFQGQSRNLVTNEELLDAVLHQQEAYNAHTQNLLSEDGTLRKYLWNRHSGALSEDEFDYIIDNTVAAIAHATIEQQSNWNALLSQKSDTTNSENFDARLSARVRLMGNSDDSVTIINDMRSTYKFLYENKDELGLNDPEKGNLDLEDMAPIYAPGFLKQNADHLFQEVKQSYLTHAQNGTLTPELAQIHEHAAASISHAIEQDQTNLKNVEFSNTLNASAEQSNPSNAIAMELASP